MDPEEGTTKEDGSFTVEAYNVIDDLPPLPKGDDGNLSDVTEVYRESRPNVRTRSMSESDEDYEDEDEDEEEEEVYRPRQAKVRGTARAKVAKSVPRRKKNKADFLEMCQIARNKFGEDKNPDPSIQIEAFKLLNRHLEDVKLDRLNEYEACAIKPSNL